MNVLLTNAFVITNSLLTGKLQPKTQRKKPDQT